MYHRRHVLRVYVDSCTHLLLVNPVCGHPHHLIDVVGVRSTLLVMGGSRRDKEC
jgi:hypothetical protein